MRILYSSNAFWATSGYGVQGMSLLPRLKELPEVEDVAMFAWYGLKGGIFEYKGMKIYPGLVDGYGNDIIGHHTNDFKADVLISLIDVWVMEGTKEKIGETEWWPWFPSDAQPISPRILHALEGADKPLVYSKWTREMAKNQGIDVTYVPHGLEPSSYRIKDHIPNKKYDLFGDDNPFVTTIVGANKGRDDRKGFVYQLGAWAKFAEKKDDVVLYLHTDPTPRFNGLDLIPIIKAYGIEDKVRFPENYRYLMGSLSSDWMADMYNHSDVFMLCSKGEGFGIPIIEAQACGIPVIVTDFSSMPELVRWGKKIPPVTMEYIEHYMAWRAIPHAGLIEAALNDTYEEWKSAGRMWPMDKRKEVSQAIHDEFDWDKIVKDYWHPIIKGEM